MSLLEDVFLEDEAGEAQELERVIDGDDYDERPGYPNSDDNEEKEDEAEEDKRRVDPTHGKTKRIVKNPRFILNPARLTGPRGIQVIPDHFKDFKFKGKGHEKEDLDMVLKKLEHWAYRLYPKFEFSDCLKKIETLGKKRPVMVHLHKIRNDQITSEETVVQNDSSDEEHTAAAPQQEDEFDKLLQQQIELARSTPVSVKKTPFTTPSADRSLLMPKATSSPSINEEQRERMLTNRRLAEERRLAKLKNNSVNNEDTDKPTKEPVIEEIIEIRDEIVLRKHNRTNVIDSSSDEEEMTINESITVEVHSKAEDINENHEVTNENHEDINENHGNINENYEDNSDSVAEKSGIANSDTNETKNDFIFDNNDIAIEKEDTHKQSSDEIEENNVKINLHTVPDDKDDEGIEIDSVKNSTVQPKDNVSKNQAIQIPSEITIQESTKEDNKAKELGDEIMDVDFDDDF